MNIGDKAKIMSGVLSGKTGFVRDIKTGRVRISSDPDPCSKGFDIRQSHWSVWADENIVIELVEDITDCPLCNAKVTDQLAVKNVSRFINGRLAKVDFSVCHDCVSDILVQIAKNCREKASDSVPYPDNDRCKECGCKTEVIEAVSSHGVYDPEGFRGDRGCVNPNCGAKYGSTKSGVIRINTDSHSTESET
jgi:hypothetical protein